MDSINIHLRLDTSPETIVQVSAALLGTVKSTITIEVITSGGSTLLYAIPTLEVYIVYIYWGTMEAMDMDTTNTTQDHSFLVVNFLQACSK